MFHKCFKNTSKKCKTSCLLKKNDKLMPTHHSFNLSKNVLWWRILQSSKIVAINYSISLSTYSISSKLICGMGSTSGQQTYPNLRKDVMCLDWGFPFEKDLWNSSMLTNTCWPLLKRWHPTKLNFEVYRKKRRKYSWFYKMTFGRNKSTFVD